MSFDYYCFYLLNLHSWHCVTPCVANQKKKWFKIGFLKLKVLPKKVT